MTDKKLEHNIKCTREFIEIWKNFYRIFNNTISESHLTETKEREVLSLRNLVSSRYEDLMDSLGVKPLRRFIANPAMHNLLSWKSFR